MRTYPFSTAHQALNYFLYTNPARQKYVNIIEADTPSAKPVNEQFSGGHPHDVWASVCSALQHVLNDNSYAERVAFELYYLHKAPEYMDQKSIADKLGISSKAFKKMFNAFESELILRELIEPPRPEYLN